MRKQIEGQINMFDYLESLKDKEKGDFPCDTCGYDESGCCGYPGDSEDYCVLGNKWKPKSEECLPLDIRGICDDAYCPKCDCGIDEFKFMDCKRCPHCGQLISWDTWHRSNDRENEEIFGKDWRKHFGKALHEGDNR